MGRNLSANALLPDSYFLVSATPAENLFQALMVLIDSCIANISKELPSPFQLKPNISYIHVCSCANIVFYSKKFLSFSRVCSRCIFDSGHIPSQCPLLD